MKEILSDHFNYILSEDEEKGIYEMVMLANNSAAYYTTQHTLSEAEVKEFKERGKDFIDSLADKYRSGDS